MFVIGRLTDENHFRGLYGLHKHIEYVFLAENELKSEGLAVVDGSLGSAKVNVPQPQIVGGQEHPKHVSVLLHELHFLLESLHHAVHLKT